MLGSGALVVLAEGTDLLAAATNVLRFFRDESCGKCVPCRVGSTKAHRILSDLLESRWRPRRRGRADRPPGGDDAAHLDLRPGPGGPGPGDECGAAERPGEWPRRLTSAVTRAGSSSPPGRSPRHWPGSGRPGAPRTETIPLAEALHRVPAAPVTAPHPLPGFARSTVDGYAVRAADTYGVVRGPARLPGRGRRGADGHRAGGHGRPGHSGGHARPAGCCRPAPTRWSWSSTPQEAMPGTIEVIRPVAPGEGVVRADEDAAAGAALVPAGRPLRAQDLGMLAAAGVTRVARACPAAGDGVLHRRRGGAAGHANAAPGAGPRRHGDRRSPR